MSDFFARPATYSYHLYLSADNQGRFWLSATDGEGPVLLRDALSPLPRYILPEYRLNREETPIRPSRLLVVRDTLLKAIAQGAAAGLHLHMSDEVELAMIVEGEEDFALTFFLDGERTSLIGRLPESLYLEPGWFGRFGDHGYELIHLPGFEEDDLDWIGRRIGADEWEELLTRAVPDMRGRGVIVRSEIEYEPEPAGKVEIPDCGPDFAEVRVSYGERARKMPELDGYVLVEGGAAADHGEPMQSPALRLRPAPEPGKVQRLLGSESGGTVRGDELAAFAHLVERDWAPLVTGEGAAKFHDLHRLYDAADWSWSLRGGPVMERGVGVVRAEPVLSAGGRRFTAAELTGAWTEGRRYLRFEDGWIDLEAPEFARSLREHGAGGGSAGLISAGFSYRQRLGLPGERAAGELPLELEGPKRAEAGEERPALAHLRYLAGWGMNGGLYGGAERQLAELGIWAAEKLAEAPDCRLLVVGRRELLTALAEAAGLGGAPLVGDARTAEAGETRPEPQGETRSVPGSESGTAGGGLRKDSGSGTAAAAQETDGSDDSDRSPDGAEASDQSPADQSLSGSASDRAGRSGGLTLLPSSLLQRTDFDEVLKADILLMLEPDIAVRSDETRLFSRLDSAEARLRIAVYSEEGFMHDARVRAVQIRLLKLFDSLTRGALLLDPNRESAPRTSARPALRDVPDLRLGPPKRESGGMAELFLDGETVEPAAKPGRGLAIPPRAGEAAWPQPDPRDTRTSKPEPSSGRQPGSAGSREAEARRAGRKPPGRAQGGDARPVRPVQPQSAEREFVRLARETADRIGPEAPFVPFSSYWPTYGAMKPEQERWYFYWRSEFRAGRKHETDLSYLFLYIYELINGIGWDDPRAGLDEMIRVWEAYRARFRRLDGYMGDWAREFALVHALDLPDSPALEQTAGQLKGELLDLELEGRFAAEPVDLNWDLIARLSDYDAAAGRFYKESGKKTMRRVAPRIVAAVDDYLVRTRGIRLTGLFRAADNRITERYLFRSAVYDPELYGRTFLVRAPKLGLHAPLRQFMTQLLRQTENELRARFKFGGRLRGIQLDKELVEVIAEAAEREFLPPEERVLPEPPKRPEVKLDLAELDKLRRDSDDVMRMLTGDLMTGGAAGEPAAQSEAKSAEPGVGAPRQPAGSMEEETLEQLEQDAEFEESGSFEPERHEDEPVPGALSFDPGEAADGRDGNADEAALQGARPEYRASAPNAEPDGGLGQMPADTGSNTAGAEAADRFSDRSADPGVRPPEEAAARSAAEQAPDAAPAPDAAGGALSSGQAEPSSAPAASAGEAAADGWDVSGLDDEWRSFAALLGPAERGMIRAVLLGLSDAERMLIAGASGELPETLVDRINEAAMDAIGDLLIDGGEVLEEYIPMLEGLRGT
ncbi:TerB N-terminal domain-containing protein [Saccharibacillus sp. CPCC 101409]|uniref:TerB N-terminal domain-containing protein n=1 Tax=Saccharibacillus sp. CPCC 101409 TaxID=3058041 RepID=UPI002673CF60|nr:TerB N-terminal domain-containing protein [Saccharibacillus sp. CPCC 101409]MDO3411283.1 TerB N-terminal domain-containing protein [Saccharibacillus sp. CPCC 101409]